jgi:hypothetical protein
VAIVHVDRLLVTGCHRDLCSLRSASRAPCATEILFIWATITSTMSRIPLVLTKSVWIAWTGGWMSKRTRDRRGRGRGRGRVLMKRGQLRLIGTR